MIRRSLLYASLQSLCRIATSVLFDLKVYGLENVPREGGALIAANHQSYLDPVLIGVQMERPLSFLAKSELFRNRFFGSLIRNLNAYPVKQGAGDVGAVKETINRLQEGHVLTMFPEGSRSPDGALGPILPGAALVIRRAQVPVVPCAIVGSFQAWPRTKKLFHPHPVRVLFGRPMVLHDRKAAEIVTMIDHELRRLIQELREKQQSEET